MGLPEKIDNWGKHGRHHGYEKFQKRQAHRQSRRVAKAALHLEEEPSSIEGKYFGWTT